MDSQYVNLFALLEIPRETLQRALSPLHSRLSEYNFMDHSTIPDMIIYSLTEDAMMVHLAAVKEVCRLVGVVYDNTVFLGILQKQTRSAPKTGEILRHFAEANNAFLNYRVKVQKRLAQVFRPDERHIAERIDYQIKIDKINEELARIAFLLDIFRIEEKLVRS